MERSPTRSAGPGCIIVILLTLLTQACDSVEAPTGRDVSTTGVYVANQGNFSDANGSVTVFDLEDESVTQALTDLGSTVQSLLVHDENLYILSNTANRIDIVPLDGGARSAITDVVSPRYMAALSETKAYVTNLFAADESHGGGSVTVLDLANQSVTGTIGVGPNPEGIAIVDSFAFVANNGFGSGRTVTVIDARSDAVVETLQMDCDGPRFVLLDSDLLVWVLCSGADRYDDEGRLVEQTNGAIRIINPATREIVGRIDLDRQIATAGPGQDAAMAPGLRQLFFVAGTDRILRYDTRSYEQISEYGPFDGDPIGAVAYDGVRERLYIARVPGFTEAGRVTEHNLRGEELRSFPAGIAPSYIDFQHEQ